MSVKKAIRSMSPWTARACRLFVATVLAVSMSIPPGVSAFAGDSPANTAPQEAGASLPVDGGGDGGQPSSGPIGGQDAPSDGKDGQGGLAEGEPGDPGPKEGASVGQAGGYEGDADAGEERAAAGGTGEGGGEEPVLAGETVPDALVQDEGTALLEEEELSEPTMMMLASRMAPLGNAKSGFQFEPVTVDGTTLANLRMQWLTPSTGQSGPAGMDRLILAPNDDTVPPHQFQLDFQLSGKDRYEPGDIEISFPAYIWFDRNGEATMELEADGLAIPEEGAVGYERAQFVWKRIGDNIVVTNNKRMPAASAVMIQGHFEGEFAHNIVDQTISEEMFCTVSVTTAQGNVLSGTSNAIDAQLDTYHVVTGANKTAYSSSERRYWVYDKVPDGMPAGFVPENPDEYIYVKWYVSGRMNGNQPAELVIEDASDGSYGGVVLGVQGSFDGDVASADGTSVTARLFDGYSSNLFSAYVWTAYPISAFPNPGQTYDVPNSVTVKSIGWDDGLESAKAASATAPVIPPKTYTVVKSWDDEGDSRGYRPDSTTAYVWRSPDGSSGNYELYKTFELDESNSWSAAWKDEGARTWQYKVTEFENQLVFGSYRDWNKGWTYTTTKKEVAGIQEEPRIYTSPVFDDAAGVFWSYRFEGVGFDAASGTYTIDNKLYVKEPQTHRIVKRWLNDDDDADGNRPETLRVWVAKDLVMVDSSGQVKLSGYPHDWVNFAPTGATYPNTYYDEHGYLVSGKWLELVLEDDGTGNYVGYFVDDDPYGHAYTVHEFSDLRDWGGHKLLGRTLVSGPGRTWEVINEDGSKTVYREAPWAYREYDRLIDELEEGEDAQGAVDSFDLENYYVHPGVTSTTYPEIPWKVSDASTQVAKWSFDYTENYDKSRRNEFYMNNVFNGVPERNTAPLWFRVAGRSYHEALAMDGTGVTDREKKDVTIEVSDDGLTFDGAELDGQDYRLLSVNWLSSPVRTATRSQSSAWDTWYWTGDDRYRTNRLMPSYGITTQLSGHTLVHSSWGGADARHDYTAVLEGLVDGEWVKYADVYRTGGNVGATGVNGATVSGSTVTFPADAVVLQTRMRATSKASGMCIQYDVKAELFASDKLSDAVYAKLDVKDYASYDVGNKTTLRVYDADGHESTQRDSNGNLLSGKSAESHEYVHAKNQRVGVTLDKNFKMTANDKVLQRIKVHATVDLTQQSNITDAREWRDARADGVLPMADSGIWYDLVPEGMLVDIESVRLGAGDKLRDVWLVENWKGSGRTLLCASVEFAPHESYTWAGSTRPASVADAGEAWPSAGYKTTQRLEYDCWYPWDKARTYGINVRNIAAFESDDVQLGNLTGYSGEPDDPDAGKHVNSMDAVTEQYKDIATNLDSKRDDNAFVYAGAPLVPMILDFAASAGITKEVALVGSDEWGTGRDVAPDTDPAVDVPEGGAYMYRYTTRADSVTILRNIVIVDSMENYRLNMEANEEEIADGVAKGWVADDGSETPAMTTWHGRLTSLYLDDLREMGIEPVVYHSTIPGLDVASMYTVIDGQSVFDYSVLSDTSVWQQGLPDDLSTVTAIAVDCRGVNENVKGENVANDGTFQLLPEEYFYWVAYMRAPNDATGYLADSDGDGTPDGRDPSLNAHAYNNVFMASDNVDAAGGVTKSWIHNDYTKVGIHSSELVVCKEWDDDGNRDGVRPGSIEVELCLDGQPTGRVATLDESNGWKAVFDHVPSVDADNNHLEASFIEREVEGYEITSINKNGSVVTMTNTHVPEKTVYPVDKTWVGDVEDGEVLSDRPLFVTFDLYADGVKTNISKTVTAATDWKGLFEGLNKYRDGGVEIVYTAVEREIANGVYVPEHVNDADGTHATNTYHPFGDLKVSKTVVNGTTLSAEKDFTFTFAFTDADGNELVERYEYETSDGRTGTIGNGGSIVLRDGQDVTVKELPHGAHYMVVETGEKGYVTTLKGDTGAIRANKTAEADFINRYSAKGSYAPVVDKILEDRQLTRGQFRFELLDSEGRVIRTASNTVDTSQTVLREGTDIGVERSGGQASFGALTFTDADDGKTFAYMVREVDTERVGYVYDDTVYTFELTPHDNGDGTMRVDMVVVSPVGHDALRFDNRYEAAGEVSLKAWKDLKGRPLADGEFEFKLMDESGTALQTKRNDANGEIHWDALQFTQDDIGKTYYYGAAEVVGNDATVNYDKSELFYKAEVYDNGDGTLSFSTNVEPMSWCAEPFDEDWFYSTDPYERGMYSNEGGIQLAQLASHYGYSVAPPMIGSYAHLWRKVGDRMLDMPLMRNSIIQAGSKLSLTVNGVERSIVVPEDIELFANDSSLGSTTSALLDMLLGNDRWRLGDCHGTFEGVIGLAPDVDDPASAMVYINLNAPLHYLKSDYAESWDVQGLYIGTPDGVYDADMLNPCDNEYGMWYMPLTEGAPADTPLFTNTTKPGNLEIVKSVDGTEGDVDTEFTFKVKLMGEDVEDGQVFEYDVQPIGSRLALVDAWGGTVDKVLGFLDSVNPFKVEKAYAASGNWQGLNWDLTNGVLTLGNGGVQAIPEFGVCGTGESPYPSALPWYSQRASIKKVATRGTIKVSWMSLPGLFYECSSLTDISSLGSWVLAEGADRWGENHFGSLESMFYGCSSLTDISALSAWSSWISPYDSSFTIKFRNTRNMFAGCSSLTDVSPLASWCLNGDASSMFAGCTSLADVSSFASWDMTDVYNVSSMFDGCTSLVDVSTLASWNTRNVRNMSAMFNGCTSLEIADASQWNMSGLSYKDNYLGFGGCTDLKRLTVSSNTKVGAFPNHAGANMWKLEDGSRKAVDSNRLFDSRTGLPVAAGTWVWDTPPIAVFDSADGSLKFYNGLTASTFTPTATQTVHSGNWAETVYTNNAYINPPWVEAQFGDANKKIKSVEVVDDGVDPVATAYWFDYQYALVSADISKLDMSRVTDMSGMFSGCPVLEELDISGLDMTKVPSTKRMSFGNCFELKRLTVSGGKSRVNAAVFPTHGNGNKWKLEDGTEVGITSAQLASRINNGTADGTWVWDWPTYTVKFKAGDSATGSMPDDQAAEFESYTIPPSTMSKAKHHQVGWVGSDGKTYDLGQEIPADRFDQGDVLTLTAIWEPNVATLQNGEFQITLRGDEKAVIETIPAGTAYAVYEQTPAGWVLVSQVDASGVIQPLETASALFTNRYDPNMTTAVFGGFKLVDGSSRDTAGYTFELVDESGNVIETMTTTDGGVVQFSPLTYTSPGDYVYTVREVLGTDMGMEYDSHDETVTVYVSEEEVWGEDSDSSTRLYAEVEYDRDGIVFDNKVVPGDLVIRKNVEGGIDSNADTQFVFKVKLNDAKGGDLGTVHVQTRDRLALIDAWGDVIDRAVEFLGDINPFKVEKAYADIVGWQNYTANGSSIKWKIDDNGVLHIDPISGDRGVLKYNTSDTGISYPPWYNNRQSITDVASSGTIELQGSMYAMFTGCSNLGECDLTFFDTSLVTAMRNMFSGCNGNFFNPDVSGWDTSSVTDMYAMFSSCSGHSFNPDVSGWNTSSVMYMTQTFQNCRGNSFNPDVSGWNTSSVITMYNMFYQCRGALFESIDISNWDMSKITNSSSYLSFNSCTNLKRLTVSSDTKIDSVFPSHAAPDTWKLEDGSVTGIASSALPSRINAGNGAGTWVWDINGAMVVFNANGGQLSGSNKVEQADATPFTITQEPVRYGYIFRGWDTVRDGSGTRYQVGDSYTPVIGDMAMLYAQWERDTRVGYKVEHYQQPLSLVDDHDAYARVDVDTYAFVDQPGETVTVEPNTYAGFVTPDVEQLTLTDGTQVVKFYYDRVRYNVAYDGNGAEYGSPRTQEFIGNVPQDLISNWFRKLGAVFQGWSEIASGDVRFGDGQRVVDLAGNGETINLFAKWLESPGVDKDPTSGEYTVVIRADQEAVLGNLPAGTSYEVVEAGILNDDGSVTPLPARGWTQTASEGAAGSIPANDQAVSTFTNRYAATGELQVEAFKHLKGRELASGEFTFELVDENGVVVETIANQAPGEAEGHVGQGSVQFSPIEVAAAGTYTYTVREVAGGADDVIYDASVLKVTVTMTDDGTGNLWPEYAWEGGDDTFDNAIKTTTLDLSKRIENATDVSKESTFTFDIALLDAQGRLVPADSYTAGKYSPDTPSGVSAQGETPTSAFATPVGADTVRFDANGGYFADGEAAVNVVAVDGTGVVEGAYVVPLAPSSGTVFDGWYTDAECSDGNEVDWASYAVQGDTEVVLYAKWIDGRTLEPVEFDAEDGLLTVSIRGGEQVNIEGLPVGTDYRITERGRDGWEQVGVTGENGTLGTGGAETEFANRYSAYGEAVLEARKTLVGTALQAGQFTFELRDEFGVLLQTALNDADGNVVFDPIAYTEADHGKAFTYWVYEQSGDDANVEYDERARKVVVTPVDNGEGVMECTVVYTMADGSETFVGGDGTEKEAGEFVNSWSIAMPGSGSGWTGMLAWIGVLYLLLTLAAKLRRIRLERCEADGGVV